MGRRSKSLKMKTENSAQNSPENSATTDVKENPASEILSEISQEPQKTSIENPQENFPKAVKERLSWPISETGKFDVSGFRESTAEQAREIARQSFLDPEFRKWAGIEQETGPLAEALFPPSIAGQALDLIASIETLAMSKKLGMPYDEVHKLMAWTAREHEVLDAQGARLARKYIPGKWLENMDLYIFITSIAGLAAGKMQAANQYAAKRLEQIGNAKDKDMGKPIDEPKLPATSNGATAEKSSEQEGKSLE